MEEHIVHIEDLIQGPFDVQLYLIDLSEFLEGTFCVISRTNKGDIHYIRNRIKYAIKRFGPWINKLPESEASFHLNQAYETLVDLLDIKEKAEFCLHEHILAVGDKEYFEFCSVDSYLDKRD